MAVCKVCFRHCDIEEGKKGFCGARSCVNGAVVPVNYGRVASLALDPIEKKPLARFYPGSSILSVGTFGCNLRCPFCQNHDISWSDETFKHMEKAEEMSPEEIAQIAVSLKDRGNIGLAFTYNEPLIGYEFILDTAKLIHEAGMKNVIVTNGTAEPEILQELSPYIDAMNIDLKGFSEHYYRDVLKGDLKTVLTFIEQSVKFCHVELTTLIVPGENDSEEEMRKMSRWIAGLKDAEGKVVGKDITLHISRFFPRFKMMDRKATPVKTILRLKEVAEENLDHVYTGNI